MQYGKLNKDYSIELLSLNEYLEYITVAGDITTQIKVTKVNTEIGCFSVSTVFLGAAWNGNWFETMVFGPTNEEIQLRGKTYEEAERLHKVAIGMVMNTLDCEDGTDLSADALEYLGEKGARFTSLEEHEQFHCLML